MVTETHRLVLGTAQWGIPRYGIANQSSSPPNETVLNAAIDRAARAGCRTIDTAWAYGDAESVVGRIVGGDTRWEVVTKTDPALEFRIASPLEARGVLDECLAVTRSRLGRARLDVVLLHRPSQRTAARGAIWDALRRRRDEGEIGALGASTVSLDDAWELLDDPDVQVLQLPASVLDQRAIDSPLAARVQERGVRVLARSAFLQGVLHLRPNELPAHLAPLRETLGELRSLAGTWSTSIGSLALRFLRDVTCFDVVVGFETGVQLDENLSFWREDRLAESVVATLKGLRWQGDVALLEPHTWPSPLPEDSR